ncbi:hypothetical protein [Streptomyces sp. NPDC058279]|uniref:hypothetical protein n=1 Tax=Streptomyces sp. NPDC058279 TaxID=3346418 RepID=UPI0036E8989E
MSRDFHQHRALAKDALNNARRYDIAITGRRLGESTLRVVRDRFGEVTNDIDLTEGG